MGCLVSLAPSISAGTSSESVSDVLSSEDEGGSDVLVSEILGRQVVRMLELDLGCDIV